MATKITSVSLDAHFSAFAEQQVAIGDYDTPDDVVHAGLPLLEEQAEKLAQLRAALIEGEQSGPATPYDFAALKADIHARYAAERESYPGHPSCSQTRFRHDLAISSVDRCGEARADLYLDAIDDAIARIADEAVGTFRCDHIAPGYLRRRAGSHYIFAIVDDDLAIIVRVLHERMNFTAHLADTPDP